MFRAKSRAMITNTLSIDFNGLKLNPKAKIFKIGFYNEGAYLGNQINGLIFKGVELSAAPNEVSRSPRKVCAHPAHLNQQLFPWQSCQGRACACAAA